MKTISLRQFRDAIPDQSEPVIVQRRDKATGEQVTLGTWTPAIPYADTWAGEHPGLAAAVTDMKERWVRLPPASAVNETGEK